MSVSKIIRQSKRTNSVKDNLFVNSSLCMRHGKATGPYWTQLFANIR